MGIEINGKVLQVVMKWSWVLCLEVLTLCYEVYSTLLPGRRKLLVPCYEVWELHL